MALCFIILLNIHSILRRSPLCDKMEGCEYKFFLTLILVVFKLKKFSNLSLISL